MAVPKGDTMQDETGRSEDGAARPDGVAGHRAAARSGTAVGGRLSAGASVLTTL